MMKKAFIVSFAIATLPATSALALCSALSVSELADTDMVLQMKGGSQMSTKAGLSSAYRNEGHIIYNSLAKEMQYCDGTSWVSMVGGGAAAASGSGGTAGCTSTSPVQWAVSATCSANPPAGVVHGTNFAAVYRAGYPAGCSNTGTYTVTDGNADFQCVDGTWVEQSGATCASQPYYHTYDESGCRGSCFTADTMVQMHDGTFKAIHKIIIGDKLRGPDGAVVTVLALDHPKLFRGKDQRMIKLNGGREFMTDNHPVMTKGGWKAVYPEMAEREDYDALQGKVGQLIVGDEIVTADGTMIVDSIEILEHDGNERRLYNLLVSGENAYFANGILAHGAKTDALGRFPLANDHDGEPEDVVLDAAA